MKFFFVFLLSVSFAVSQTITTGLPFLKLGSDARSTAMGEAFTAIGNDHSSFFYNPASLRFNEQRQIMLSHRQGFSDITSDYLGATIPGESLSFGISAFTTSINEIEVRQRPGESEGTFNARNAAISAGTAFSLSDDMSIGVSGKLLYEKIYIDEASGYAFDGGMIYVISDDITAGLSVLNIGSMSALRSDQSAIPTMVRMGASYHSSISTDISLIAAGDFLKTIDDKGSHVHLGVESVFNSIIMIRAGYQTGYSTKSFSGGFGLLYGFIRVDYSFLPANGAFSSNHAFTLNFYL